MSDDKYSITLGELAQFLRSAQKLKAELNFLLWYGRKRLNHNMHQWKNADKKPSYTEQNPPYPYNEKNVYVNAANNLWHETLWEFAPELNEIYYMALLDKTREFENRETYHFNKGIIYGNLGVAQSAQMKIDEGFANILKALVEDKGYSTTSPDYDIFKRELFAQFESRYVRKLLQDIVSQLNVAGTSPFDHFVADFLNYISTDQRTFFDYTFTRIMQNLEIWKEKENSFTSNRLLAYTQDFCLFNEDFLKTKIPPSTISTRPHWELRDLIMTAFSTIDLAGCGANSMTDLDGKLASDLNRLNQTEKCLRILLTLRNYSSHNVAGGTSANVFYNRYHEILAELIRAMCYITLLP